MLGKLTNITHSYWSHAVWHTKTTPYSASKLFQSNPMNPEGSECVWVCVCPSGVKPGVFSIKAIHPLWQLSALAPFSLHLFSSNLVNSGCVHVEQPFSKNHSLLHTYRLFPTSPLNKYILTHTEQNKHTDTHSIIVSQITVTGMLNYSAVPHRQFCTSKKVRESEMGFAHCYY